MKKRVVFVVLIIALVLFLGLTLLIYPSTDILTDETILGAHRGNSVDYIENTLPAFESALVKDEYKFIEFDVQYSKDKELVVHHDLSLTRIQHKPNKIKDLTYKQLLDVSDYHIPTYKEVMDLIAGKKPLNIEIKSQGDIDDDLEIADFVVKDLEERGIVKTTLISSISFELINEFNRRYNNLSNYTHYYNFWGKQKRYIDTGLIFYVDESTFTQRISWLGYISEFFRNIGLYDSMHKSWWLSGANHLMIHGANIRHYNNIRPKIPFNSRVVYWTFDDKMYLVLPDKEIWDWEKEANGFEIEEVNPWWYD